MFPQFQKGKGSHSVPIGATCIFVYLLDLPVYQIYWQSNRNWDRAHTHSYIYIHTYIIYTENLLWSRNQQRNMTLRPVQHFF